MSGAFEGVLSGVVNAIVSNWWGFALILGVVLLKFSVPIFRRLGSAESKSELLLTYPSKRPSILTSTERRFFHFLDNEIGNRADVFCQVRLIDLLDMKSIPDRKSRRVVFNKVVSKHVDFVVAEKGSLRTVLVVELDDASHARKDRKERDEFVDRVLQEAGISFVRVPVSKSYEPALICDHPAIAGLR